MWNGLLDIVVRPHSVSTYFVCTTSHGLHASKLFEPLSKLIIELPLISLPVRQLLFDLTFLWNYSISGDFSITEEFPEELKVFLKKDETKKFDLNLPGQLLLLLVLLFVFSLLVLLALICHKIIEK